MTLAKLSRVAVVASALVAFAGAARADEIVLYKGDTLTNVTVTNESYEGLTYKKKGIQAEQSLAAAKVREVRYTGKKSKFYEFGEDALAAGDLAKAAEFFKTAAAPAKNWEKQYGLFQVAECLRRMNKLEDAIKAYNELLTAVPKTRFYGDCYERIAQCQRAQRKPDEAKATYEQLKGQVTLKSLGQRWELLADFRLLELDEKNDSKKALTGYQDLQAKAAEFPDVANMARLRVGYVMIQQGQIDKARKFFEDIIKDRQASDTAVVAGAYNGLGSTFISKEKPSVEEFDQALFPFFRTIFHYGDELKGNDLLAEALFKGGTCLAARPGENNQKRAKQLFSRCKGEFPTSEWGKLAALK
ncbi:MAG: tetratricopeptide repeat protein [Planctomycetes bacterium]|nr:tetratricopeptide repeat protein [Planctomycetota bacterium]